jgi:hypothetical protein
VNPVEPKIEDGFQLIIFGINQQKDYHPLPAAVNDTGTVVTEWELSAEDLAMIFEGGRIKLQIAFTGVHQGKPLSPIKIEVIKDASD